MMISNRSAASHVWAALKTWKLLCAFKVLAARLSARAVFVSELGS